MMLNYQCVWIYRLPTAAADPSLASITKWTLKKLTTRKQMETTELFLVVMNLASRKTILTYRVSTWIPPNLSKALRTRDPRSLRVDSWSLF